MSTGNNKLMKRLIESKVKNKTFEWVQILMHSVGYGNTQDQITGNIYIFNCFKCRTAKSQQDNFHPL